MRYVHCVACKGREVCGSSWFHMFTVTQRLGVGLEDRAKAAQVRLDFSAPSRCAAPCIRPTGLCSRGPSPVEADRRGGEQIEKRFWKM